MRMANPPLDIAPGAGRWAWWPARGAALAALLIGFIAASAVRAEPLGATFRDDFTSFDTARWYGSDGWSHGAQQTRLWSSSEGATLPGQDDLNLVTHPTERQQSR